MLIWIVLAIVVFGYFYMTRFGMAQNGMGSNNLKLQKISPEDTKIIMEKENVILLDVRAPQEYAQGHIEGAINLSSTDIARVEDIIPNKDSKVIVYCRSGARSRASTTYMLRMGYTNVLDMGSISSWPHALVR